MLSVLELELGEPINRSNLVTISDVSILGLSQ